MMNGDAALVQDAVTDVLVNTSTSLLSVATVKLVGGESVKAPVGRSLPATIGV